MAEIDVVATTKGPAAGLAAARALIDRIRTHYLDLEDVNTENDELISKLESDLAEVSDLLSYCWAKPTFR